MCGGSGVNDFDVLADKYDDWFIENDKLFESELEAVRRFIPSSGEGVEIGVGTGIFAERLGIRCGVEPSENMAAAAKTRGIKVWDGKAEKLPFEDGRFDFALMITVDSFLDDINIAFAEIRRILKYNGRFIIAFIDRDTPLGKQYDQNKHESESYKNAIFRSASEMRDILDRSGFVVLGDVQTVFSLKNTVQKIVEGTGSGVFAVIASGIKSFNEI
ncbi:class I SAM-dependent methyltransferase [Candidatus Nomurabacteria bacterium]|nr:class I SAM-dependent methyltransferase [Candidatus Nomurabacteria bacterium]